MLVNLHSCGYFIISSLERSRVAILVLIRAIFFFIEIVEKASLRNLNFSTSIPQK